MPKPLSVNLRALREALGRWVNSVAFTQRPINITNNRRIVAQIVPSPGCHGLPSECLRPRKKPRPVAVDSCQGAVQSTLRAAKKLAGKLAGKPRKKAGKRTHPAPKNPAPTESKTPTST